MASGRSYRQPFAGQATPIAKQMILTSHRVRTKMMDRRYTPRRIEFSTSYESFAQLCELQRSNTVPQLIFKTGDFAVVRLIEQPLENSFVLNQVPANDGA